MNILVIGSGGREHALTWKLKQSPAVDRIFCAVGNAGTAQIAENVPIPANDFPGLIKFAKQNKIDLTVVGPDDPLAAGIVDSFQAEGLRIFGPIEIGRAPRIVQDLRQRIDAKESNPDGSGANFCTK